MQQYYIIYMDGNFVVVCAWSYELKDYRGESVSKPFDTEAEAEMVRSILSLVVAPEHRDVFVTTIRVTSRGDNL